MTSQARVLVVDDDRLIRELAADLLSEAGLGFSLAATGQQALDAARDPGIGVAVLDVELPDLSGLEVFRRLRAERPEVEVVVISGRTSQQRVLEALRLGAFDYLAKPLHEEEFRLVVRRALSTHEEVVARRRLDRRLRALGPLIETMWEQARVGGDGVRALREATLRAAADVAEAERTSLLLLDEDGVSLRVEAARGAKLDPEQVDPVAVGDGAAGVAFARGEPLLVADVAGDPRFAGRAPEGRYHSNSFVVMPVGAGRPCGVLCVTEPLDGEPFDDEDVALLRVLTAQVAPLLNAGRGREAEEAEPLLSVEAVPEDAGAEAELARAVCDAITAHVEPGRVLAAALEAVARSLDAAPVALFLADEAGELLREAQAGPGLREDRARLPHARGIAGTAFEAGQIVATEAPEADPRFDPEVDTPEDGRAGPLLCGPLRFRGESLGVFRAFLPRGAAASARSAEVLTAALSAAVRNALLYRSLIDSIEEVARARRESAR